MVKFLVKTSQLIDIKLHIILNQFCENQSGVICEYISNKLQGKKPQHSICKKS